MSTHETVRVDQIVQVYRENAVLKLRVALLERQLKAARSAAAGDYPIHHLLADDLLALKSETKR